MSWYDLFALTYDVSLEKTYRPHRELAVAKLALAPGAVVLDLCCGTGQNFDLIVPEIGEGGLVGVDLSKGMLGKARKRCARNGWSNVTLVRKSAQEVSAEALVEHGAPAAFDAVLCTLGLSVVPDAEDAFARSFALLRPGGRYVIMDVHADERVLQSTVVEVFARANLSREVWKPLEAAAADFTRSACPNAPAQTVGGTLFIACGTKP